MNRTLWNRIWESMRSIIRQPLKSLGAILIYIYDEQGSHRKLEILLTGLAIFVAWRLLTETQKQVIVMSDSAKRELKAYVYLPSQQPQSIEKNIVDSIKANSFFSRDSSFPFLLKNFGKTPAYNVSAFVFFYLRDSPPVVDTIGYGTLYNILIPPETEVLHLGKFFPGTDLSIEKKGMMKWIAGKLQYMDTFGDTTVAVFCYKYVSKHNFYVTEYFREEVRPKDSL